MADPVTLLTVGMGVMNAAGGFLSQSYQAHQAEQHAKIGEIQAAQIDTAYREDFASTVANIQSIRASSGAAPDSPTSMAIINENRRVSDRNRTREVDSRRMQANQSRQDAKFYRGAAVASLGTEFMRTGLAVQKLRTPGLYSNG